MALETAMKVRQTKEIEVPNLGERIREARKASGKTLNQICAQIGYSREYWNTIEKERLGSISIETVRSIESLLNIDLGVKFDD